MLFLDFWNSGECGLLFCKAICCVPSENLYLMGYAVCRPPIIAHCFRIADSWHCCKRVLEFVGTQTCQLAYLVASLWRPWGTVGRVGETGAHIVHYNKGHFKVQARNFTDLLWMLVPMGVILHGLCFFFTVLGDPETILGRSWDTRESRD